jgi:Fic family protein
MRHRCQRGQWRKGNQMTWPPHTQGARRWSGAANQRALGGRRPPIEDRTLGEISVSIPPRIADLPPGFEAETRVLVEAATIEVTKLDVVAGGQLGALSGFLLRSESVASSRIERINADTADAARAMAGLEAGRDAQLTAAAARAVSTLINAEPAKLDTAMLEAHSQLLGDDPVEGPDAGRVRTVQNWIGGSDFSPRNALYVPPPPDLVGPLLEDLFRFAQRVDFGAIAQAAIVHAQFESIHPFTDGNGRIGRALINTVLRHRGLTSAAVVPIASVMLADTYDYFARLGAYRSGDADGFVRYLARAALIAVEAAAESASALAALPERWAELAGTRARSAAAVLTDQLLEHPVVTSSSAMELAGGASRSAVFAALEQLEAAEVLTEITGQSRERVWVAHDVLDELDRLTERVGVRTRPT